MKAIYTYHKQSFVCIDATNEHSHVRRSTRLDSWNNPYATLIIKILITLMEKMIFVIIFKYKDTLIHLEKINRDFYIVVKSRSKLTYGVSFFVSL